MRHSSSATLQHRHLASLLLAALCVLLTACSFVSTNTSPSVSGHGASATATPKKPKVTQDISLILNTTEVATVQQVQLRATIACGPWLVLAPHAPTYSQSELAAISQFVSQHSALIVGPEASNGYDPGSPTVLPPTLQFIPGNETCQGTYEITNTGSTLVQVNGVGFQTTQAVAAFTHEYHLLDACPYLRICSCGGCGAASTCSYKASVQLTPNASLLMQDFPASADPNCPAPVNVQPGTTLAVSVAFQRPAGDTRPGVWSRGMPALDMTLPQGRQTLTYPTLLNNLVFVTLTEHLDNTIVTAPDGQMYGGYSNTIPGACYTQQGNTFTPVTSFTSRLDLTKDPNWPVYSPVCF